MHVNEVEVLVLLCEVVYVLGAGMIIKLLSLINPEEVDFYHQNYLLSLITLCVIRGKTTHEVVYDEITYLFVVLTIKKEMNFSKQSE